MDQTAPETETEIAVEGKTLPVTEEVQQVPSSPLQLDTTHDFVCVEAETSVEVISNATATETPLASGSGDQQANAAPVEETPAVAPVEEVKKKITPKLHIIDGDCSFIGDIDNYYKAVGMADSGLAYHTLTIFGSQSTGKSTLLNDLFGTCFEMMDASRGPQQTTKGVWLSKSHTGNVFIFDVEGTDSGERGENSLIERRTSLFSIAVAEVVIINMFAANVGTYHGANIGLLRNILEVNLQVFAVNKSITKTTIVIILRDYFTYLNIDHLRTRITGQITNLWSKISFPEGYENLKFEDFFNLHVIDLPSKMVFPDQYIESVGRLREYFLNTKSEKYVYEESNTKAVPIDGFGSYVHQIWDVICSNHDLDIPSEKELLATHRCNEIADTIVKGYSSEVAKVIQVGLSAKTEHKVLSLRNLVNTSMETYNSQCRYYTENVRKKVAQTVLENLVSLYQSVFNAQLQFTCDAVFSKFESTLKRKILVDQVTKDFLSIVTKASEEALAELKLGVQTLSSPSFDCDASAIEAHLKTRINNHITHEKNHQLTLFSQDNQMDVDDAISTFRDITDSINYGFWGKVTEKYEEICTNFREAIPARLEQFGASDDQVEKAISTTLKDLKNAIRQHLNHFLSTQELVSRHFKFFHHKFNFSGGAVRVWGAQEDVKVIYDDAKDKTLSLFKEIVDIPELPEIVFKTSFSSAEKESMTNNLQGRMSESYQIAANQVALLNAQNKVPFWAIILITILGFNEFVWVLTNPIGVLFLLIVAVVGYIFYTMPPEMRSIALNTGMSGAQAFADFAVSKVLKNKRD